MSKLISNRRQYLIIRKLQTAKRMTFQEIDSYLSRESELHCENLRVSVRTLQRDIREIESLYGVYIKNHRSGKYYYIDEEFEPETNERIFEAFDVYNALKIGEHAHQHLYLERRQTQGTQHLLGLLHAIRNKVQISFVYQKYHENEPTQRTVAPLALKEFKKRWYLIAYEVLKEQIRTFPIDRMSDLEILRKKSPKIQDFDLNEMMRYTFGIITPSKGCPEKIVLSFTPFQGKYVKSLPLHDTQKILMDNEDELRVSLNIFPAHDFKMEILSLGDRVKVLEPKWFAEELKETYTNALKQYK